jgi:hypothetical protein
MISHITMEKGLAMMMSSQKQKRTRSCTKRYLNKGFPAGCVCNEIFVIPTVVDCGHTFCRFCLSEMARRNQNALSAASTSALTIQSTRSPGDGHLHYGKLHTFLSPEIRMKRDNLLVAERVIEKGKAALKATAEARDRRGLGLHKEC